MALRRRMAVTLPASPFVKDTVERVKWAEANGYTDAWFGDGGAPDALTTAAALGGVAPSVRIGVAVTPVYTRTPAVLATPTPADPTDACVHVRTPSSDAKFGAITRCVSTPR